MTDKRKLTKPQLESLAEIHRRGGAVLTSEWTNGSGRYITARAIPPFCERIERLYLDLQPKRIQKIFANRPRCKAVIAITNMRAANRALGEAQQ